MRSETIRYPARPDRPMTQADSALEPFDIV